MAHDHGGHGHASPGKMHGSAFLISVVLNSVFVVVEVVYGLAAHSMALVADAAHNLSDVLGLALAWGATALATRRPSERRTYGFRRSTILAALANAILLLVAVGGVAWEAVGRFSHPGKVEGWTVLTVAAVGIAINGVAAFLLSKGSKGDLNARGAFLHMVADAAVSVGVVITGALILRTGWMWLDPVVSLAISVVILFGTWSLLRQSVDLALDAVPPHINLQEVKSHLENLPGIVQVHDLHIWAMSTTECALTVHLVTGDGALPQTFLRELSHQLEHKFEIHHVTCQVEPGEAAGACKQGPDEVV